MEIPEDEFDYWLQCLTDAGLVEITKNGAIKLSDKGRKMERDKMFKLVNEMEEHEWEKLEHMDHFPVREEFVKRIDKTK